VPITEKGPDGKDVPVMGPDGKPKTRWALNTNVGDDIKGGQIPQAMLDQWKQRLYEHRQAQIAAVDKVNEEREKRGEKPIPGPEATPELAGYKPPASPTTPASAPA